MFDVARAHGKVEDFSCAHENSFERGALSRLVEPFDRVDHERSRDFVDLAGSQRVDDVALHAALLVLVRDDAPALQATPKLEDVAKRVAVWGAKQSLFPFSTCNLFRLC